MTSYYATTSAEKAKALRLETKGTVEIVRERDSRVIRTTRGPRLVGREIFVVTPKVMNTRTIEITSREIHRGDELPVGDGWVRIEHIPENRYSIWERKDTITIPA